MDYNNYLSINNSDQIPALHFVLLSILHPSKSWTQFLEELKGRNAPKTDGSLKVCHSRNGAAPVFRLLVISA